MALRNDILGFLQRGDATAEQITQALFNRTRSDKKKSRTNFSQDVNAHGQVLSTLLALKHEHRVWTTDHSKWTITSKGKKSHG